MKLFKRILIIVMLTLTMTIGMNLTLEKKLDPKEVVTWPGQLFGVVRANGVSIVIVLHTNPEQGDEPRRVKGLYIQNALIACVYYEDNKPVELRFNIEHNRYEKRAIPERSANLCLDCHLNTSGRINDLKII